MKYTLLLIFLMVGAFLFAVFGVADVDAFYATWGFSGANLVERPLVLITSIFMHANLTHLLSNVLILFFFGHAVEKELGAGRMLLIFFIGAFAGDVLSLGVYSFNTLAVGASAGVFALIGVGMLAKPLDLSFYPMIIPIPLAFLGLLYIVYNIYGFVTGVPANIAYAAHFGGLFVGLIAGFHHTGARRGLIVIGWTVLAAVLSYLILSLLL